MSTSGLANGAGSSRPRRLVGPWHRNQRRCRPSTAKQRGFGLLEALVALVVFSLSGLALFSWINNNLAGAARLSERQADSDASAQALAWLQTLNPMQQPQGQTELAPGLNLSWTSRALSAKTVAAPFPGGISTPFRLQLYEVEASLQRSGQPGPLRLTITRVGHERDPLQVVVP